MIRLTVTLAAFLAAAAVQAQDFNYTPGWANTYNFNRLHSGAEGDSTPQNLELCRFDMLSQADQQRLHERATALVATHGEAGAAPYLEQQSKEAIREMVNRGLCRGE